VITDIESEDCIEKMNASGNLRAIKQRKHNITKTA
jgi:hypothetical protein